MKYFIQSKLFNFIVYYKYLVLLKQSGYSLEKKKKVQQKKIRRLVKAALKHPLYQKKFTEAGVDPALITTPEDLKKIPILTKNEYRDMILACNIGSKKYKHFHKDHTSGSTGVPLHTCLSPAEYATLVAKRLLILHKNGYRIFRDSSLDMSSPAHKGTRKSKSLFQKIGLLRKTYVSTMDDPKDIVEAIIKEKPTSICAGKSILHTVLLYAKKHGIELPKVKMVENVAEAMDDTSANLIEYFFGDNVITDSYASVECGIIAYSLRFDRRHFFLDPLQYVYSIRDENSNETDEGELFVTNLYLLHFPMINYKQGDFVESALDEKGERYIKQVHGRNDDKIISRDGQRFSFHYLFAFLPRTLYLEQYRVIQESYDDLKLILVMKKDSQIDKAVAEKEITENLDRYLKTKMKYTFEWVDQIPIDANGKIRVLISKIKQ